MWRAPRGLAMRASAVLHDDVCQPWRPASQLGRILAVFGSGLSRSFECEESRPKISQVGEKLGYPLVCVGIPKTVDNDLAITDNCPGFGSVAKYVATSIREAGFDVASMSKTSTRVFVMEVMGRHAGWITAACGLAAEKEGDAPQILLFPEIRFDEERFLARVKEIVERDGYCAIAVSEGLQNREGKFLSETGLKDAFGHSQLGGAGEIIARLVRDRLNYKYHWALADYLQRAARHIASKVDVEQSYKLGAAAVKLAIQGRNAVMPVIERSRARSSRRPPRARCAARGRRGRGTSRAARGRATPPPAPPSPAA